MLNDPVALDDIHSNRDDMIEMYLKGRWGNTVAEELDGWFWGRYEDFLEEMGIDDRGEER